MVQQNNTGGILDTGAMHGRLVQAERERDYCKELLEKYQSTLEDCAGRSADQWNALPEEYRKPGVPIAVRIKELADAWRRATLKSDSSLRQRAAVWEAVYKRLLRVPRELLGSYNAPAAEVAVNWIDDLEELAIQAHTDEGGTVVNLDGPLGRWQIVDHQTGDIRQFVTDADGKTFLEVTGSVIGVEDVPDGLVSDDSGTINVVTDGDADGFVTTSSAEPDHPPGCHTPAQPRAREAESGQCQIVLGPNCTITVGEIPGEPRAREASAARPYPFMPGDRVGLNPATRADPDRLMTVKGAGPGGVLCEWGVGLEVAQDIFATEDLRLIKAAEPSAREAPAGDPRFHALLRKIGELHDRKQKDYGVAGDPFANIRASTAFGVPAWVGAVLRGNDKMKRIQAFIQNGKLANEPVEDSLLDLAVYAMIALILFQEGQEQQRAA